MTKKTIFTAMSTPEIFAFYKEFFPNRKRPVSLRQFAALLGYRSPRTIGMIIQGQRMATKTILQRLISAARLQGAERAFCELLWETEDLLRRDPQNQKISDLQQKIKNLRKEGFSWRNLDQEKIKLVLEWHYAVLLAGLDSPHFPQDPEEISKLLGHRVSPLSIRDSLATLRDLNLIEKTPQNQRWRTTKEGFSTPADIADISVRKSHRAILQNAQRALEKYPTHQREYIHVAFPASAEKLPEIKKQIRDFVLKITHSFWDSETVMIHRLGLFLYPETTPPHQQSQLGKFLKRKKLTK